MTAKYAVCDFHDCVYSIQLWLKEKKVFLKNHAELWNGKYYLRSL